MEILVCGQFERHAFSDEDFNPLNFKNRASYI